MGVCVLLVGFCVLFCFVFLVLFWFSNCLIPFSSHKSCGGFQVLVEGHWTYALTYVLVRRVSLRLLNLDCRYPRDLLQPARKKKVSSSHDTTGATGDVKMERESSLESSSDSSDSNSDFSSEDGSSDVSDLDKFEEAYEEFGKLTAGVDPKVLERHMAGHTSDDVPGLSLAGGLATLRSLANVPKTWPLARLTIPLSGFTVNI